MGVLDLAQRLFELGISKVLKAYGLDSLNLSVEKQSESLETCQSLVRKSKSTTQTLTSEEFQVLNACALKYSNFQAEKIKGREKDAFRFISRPKNLELLLPGMKDNAKSKFHLVKKFVSLFPWWCILLAAIPAFIIGLYLMFLFFITLPDMPLISKFFNMGVFMTIVGMAAIAIIVF
jgi:hypothetical protein